MCHTYKQCLYQIVFSTKYREKTLDKENRARLFKYLTGILKNKNCHLYQINGVEDHLHIILSLHASISVAGLVQSLKVGSNFFIKNAKIFPQFNGWQIGYSYFTYSIEAKNNLINYVKNQEAHHKKISSKEELIMLLDEHKVEYNLEELE